MKRPYRHANPRLRRRRSGCEGEGGGGNDRCGCVYTAHLSARNSGVETAVGRPAGCNGPGAVSARVGKLSARAMDTTTAVWQHAVKVERLEKQEQEYQAKVQQLFPEDLRDFVRGNDQGAPGGRDAVAENTVATANRTVPRGGLGEQPPVGGLPYLVSTRRFPTYGAGIGPRHGVGT